MLHWVGLGPPGSGGRNRIHFAWETVLWMVFVFNTQVVSEETVAYTLLLVVGCVYNTLHFVGVRIYNTLQRKRCPTIVWPLTVAIIVICRTHRHIRTYFHGEGGNSPEKTFFNKGKIAGPKLLKDTQQGFSGPKNNLEILLIYWQKDYGPNLFLLRWKCQRWI